jgi:hypothetical protein
MSDWGVSPVKVKRGCPFKLYYGSDDWEHLVGTIASAFPDQIIFLWEAREGLYWKGSEDFQYFGAPYRAGAVSGFHYESPAIRGTHMLRPGAEELEHPCVACSFRANMLAGDCSLFAYACEKRGRERWKEP